ncbi:thiol-disulfide oxidoreductase DCC family protein [Rubritalea spongiae]|uniref:Thiol-disulfide oxidoreductase DCC family protein n=1 Tax=Rubritalea spongiae TaxID=430797 RepID=A0ABW5E531_9BACT
MKLDEEVEWVEVYYDGKCGMCCTFHEWINAQERANEIRFFPYQGVEAQQHFPELHSLDPAREMVVRTANGGIYRAAEAWVWCLWSCVKYRGLAEKFSHPRLLPQVQKLCHLLAANRITLSKVFFRGKMKQVTEQLHQMPGIDCAEGCALPQTIDNEREQKDV